MSGFREGHLQLPHLNPSPDIRARDLSTFYSALHNALQHEIFLIVFGCV
jgi:hypothetical protein